MATKTANLVLVNDGLRFEATSGSGHTIVLDDGQCDSAMRPAELVPIAIAACSAMDVASILRKKRQPFTRYEIRASGVQMDEHPNAFLRADITHVVEGEGLDREAVARAIQLSATKYCSVGATISSGGVEIHHGFVIRDAGGESAVTEVVVTGPHQSPADLVALAHRESTAVS